jgi:SAM-dependent methyltransferase
MDSLRPDPSDRRARLLGRIDFRTAVGLEIGALHSPPVRRDEGRILYVDYAPTEVLRHTLRRHDVSPADLLEVDIVWGDTRLRAALGEPADYVVARHVVEHVPDLIGWLAEIHEALKPGGTLGLAVPDRRFTFDACRAETGIAEVVAAHLEQRRRPSVQQIFDVAAFAAGAIKDQDWRHRGDGAVPTAVLHALPDLYRWIAAPAGPADGYTDAHCWVFTPASFLSLAEALAAIDCFPFLIEAFYPTEPAEIEFQARLRAALPNSCTAIRAAITQARRRLPADAAYTPEHAVAAELRAANARLQEALACLQQSRSWRLTAPLRAAARWLRRPPGSVSGPG